tara:strand:- start:3642 stop:4943 length:1302 start_codon:yes stop_codon:yes gene_type:complete
MANAQNPGDIKKFSISSNTKGFSIDISPSISEFRYFESVLSNTITATAAVIDSGVQDKEKDGTGSVLDYLPLRGGERADIVVSDYMGRSLVLELYVNRVRNSQPGSRSELFFIDFVSSQYFANEQYRVTQRFKDAPISSHANQILGALQAPIIGIDATAGNYNFYGNDRKPFYVLTWLASKAIPSSAGRGSGVGGAAGYMFYQTRGGFHFRSIDSLLKAGSKKKLAYTNTTGIESNYDGKIVKYDINVDVDVQQNLSLGVYKNRTIYYDPLSFSYVVQDFGVDDQNKKIDTAAKSNATKLINQELLTTPTRLMSAVLDVGFNQPGTGDQQLETNTDNRESKPNDKTTKNLVQSVMRYNQLFTVQTEITIPGDFDIVAGDIVNCTFPEIGRDKKVEINKETSGDYLVAHVCHRTTPRDTYSSLTLVRDSYGAKK